MGGNERENIMTTIDKKIILEGIGLHSGAKCETVLSPYNESGLFFKFGDKIVKATAEKVCDTSRCTMLDLEGHIVQTCEHLLSSIYALGIDSILIEMSADEVPTFDGSGKVWYDSLKDCVVGTPNEAFSLKETIRVEDKDAFIEAKPREGFVINYSLDYPHPMIGKSNFVFTKDKFEEFVAPSRTFALYEEVEFLRANGLAKGGSEENCIVVFKDKLSTPLRHSKEFATHKILDLMGDISLCGMPLNNIEISANKSGHKLNNVFAKKLRTVIDNA